MRICVVAVCGLLALPGSAVAKTPNLVPIVPPSNSGADQYVENVPTATGNRSTTGLASRHHSRGSLAPSAVGPVLAAPTQGALVRQGRDGRRVVAIANATAPASAHRRVRAVGAAVSSGGGSGRAGSSGDGSSSGGIPGGSGSATGAVTRSLLGVSGGGGMDGALPVVLAVTAVGIGIVAVRRRLG